jgi:hypothetical protein
MKSKRIYLTARQIEELISGKKIILNANNLKIDKASAKYKFSILVKEENITGYGQYFIVFFSAVEQFEIPSSEKNLYTNHLHIPKGMLETVNRKTPKDNTLPEMDFGKDQNDITDAFIKIRRALNKLILFGYSNENYQEKIENFIQNLFNGLSELQKKLINELKSKENFPVITINQIKSNEFFKYLWWGKFIIDNVLSPLKGVEDDKKLEKHLTWLRTINVDNILSNHKIFRNFPEPVQKEKAVLLGYLLSASVVRSAEINFEEQFIELLRSLKINEKEHYDILFWGMFFDTFFDETANTLFPNPLIREDFLEMEKLAFQLASSLNDKTPDTTSGITPYKFKKINKEKLILLYHSLLDGKSPDKVMILDEKDVTNPFSDAMLFGSNRKTIGFINEDIDSENRLLFDETSFSLRGTFSPRPVIFYGSMSPEEKEMLKNAGISLKIRQPKKLISKNKKVLVGFLTTDTLKDGLVKFYRKVVKDTTITEFIFVWMVNDSSLDLQSTGFALEKDDLKNHLEKSFGIPVKIFVKSPSGPTQEIVRNLSLALKNYQTKNIEVVDHQFTNEQAEWLLLSGKEYVIKKRDVDYFHLAVH